MFLEGKNIISEAKSDLRYAWLTLFLFIFVVFIFVVISSFNFYYVGFLAVFLVFFLAICIYLKIEKRKGIKQCIYAIENSKSSDIVAKQIDSKLMSKVFVNSISSTIDVYDEQEKFPTFRQKIKRKRKHTRIMEEINKFEEEEEKVKNKNN